MFQKLVEFMIKKTMYSDLAQQNVTNTTQTFSHLSGWHSQYALALNQLRSPCLLLVSVHIL